MVTTHRELDGDWAVCPEPRTCPLKFHFPDMTPEAMAAMPYDVLLALLEAIDPPTAFFPGEYSLKQWLDADGQLHRGYDLPAETMADGLLYAWYRYGQRHREGGKPAKITRGRQEWWLKDQQQRVAQTKV